MKEGFWVEPIAHIETDYKEKFGIPRQSGTVKGKGRIVFLPKYRNPDALREIEGFSHLWLIFDFSLAHRDEWSPTVRPPRLGGNRRVGVFASRSPYRPNPIGLSCVRLVCVEHSESEGDVLVVEGADLLCGTPIIDIKPYLPFADSKADAKGGYAEQMRDYALSVFIPEEQKERLSEERLAALTEILSEDPRPSYQDDENRVYHMSFGEYEVDFCVKGGVAEVKEIREKA